MILIVIVVDETEELRVVELVDCEEEEMVRHGYGGWRASESLEIGVGDRS